MITANTPHTAAHAAARPQHANGHTGSGSDGAAFPFASVSATEPETDALGKQLAQLLHTQWSHEAWPHARSERLRAARAQALTLRKRSPERLQTALQPAWALGDAQRPGLGGWGWLGSALPMLALVLGLVALAALDHDQNLADLASIDSALLIDDLPPTAYGDVGFVQFLRQPSAPAPAPE